MVWPALHRRTATTEMAMITNPPSMPTIMPTEWVCCVAFFFLLLLSMGLLCACVGAGVVVRKLGGGVGQPAGSVPGTVCTLQGAPPPPKGVPVLVLPHRVASCDSRFDADWFVQRSLRLVSGSTLLRLAVLHSSPPTISLYTSDAFFTQHAHTAVFGSCKAYTQQRIHSCAHQGEGPWQSASR